MPKDLPPCPYWDAAPVVCEHWHDPPPRAPIDWVRVIAGGVVVVVALGVAYIVSGIVAVRKGKQRQRLAAQALARAKRKSRGESELDVGVRTLAV